MKKQRYPVGIDLGTTFSSLAYVNEAGQPQVIRFTDDDSSIAATSYSIASAIYFQSESEVVVGNRALDFALLDPLRVARVFKRQMGEPEYRREVGRDTYETFEVEGRCYRPEELSAMVLRRLKETAESQLGPIQDVVVSVPYVFDEVRRRATQDAAKIAGFVNVDLVDEPVAAAMAFGHTLFRGLEEQKTFDDEALSYIYDDRVILVYDLGGGTFDATLMRLGRDGVFEVLATAGDWRLGGEDWDNILLGILCEKVQSLTGSDPRNEPALLQELWLKAVQAKQTLSEKPRAEVVFFHNEDEHTIVLTRGDFQRESRHLLARTSDTISEMFARADIKWNVVECVVIVGGASRMPMVREHLENVSKRGHLDMSLSPDTAIAKGAALFAAMNSGQTLTSGIKDVETVNSHPLGLLVKDPRTKRIVNDVLIEANQKTGTRVARTYRLQNRRLRLVVLEGELPDPDSCVRLGQATFQKLPAGLPERAEIEVVFLFDKNGLLRVEGRIPAPQGKVLRVHMNVEVEGRMTEEGVEAATGTLRGVDFI